MPRLDGLDTLREIKAFDPSIRVVVVTGSANQEIRSQAEASGANAFLKKPVQPEVLVGTVKGLR
jgi:two-component system chemotaxis response regulator CheY